MRFSKSLAEDARNFASWFTNFSRTRTNLIRNHDTDFTLLSNPWTWSEISCTFYFSSFFSFRFSSHSHIFRLFTPPSLSSSPHPNYSKFSHAYFLLFSGSLLAWDSYNCVLMRCFGGWRWFFTIFLDLFTLTCLARTKKLQITPGLNFQLWKTLARISDSHSSVKNAVETVETWKCRVWQTFPHWL